MKKSVLILGSHGRFGRHAAEAFWNAGWSIRVFDRRRDTLDVAADHCDVIVNAWNPLYPDWAAQVAKLHEQVQQVACKTGATVIVPGNVYVFGPRTPAPWGVDSDHAAQNPLGRIRIDLEQSYRNSGVRTIFLRAGDFIDTEASGNWLDKIMLPGVAKGRFTYPGRTDIPHAWAYLPDLARAAVALAEMRDDLNIFEDVPFPGCTLTAEDIAATLSDIAGHAIATRRMSWVPLHIARPFWPMGRCLLEMRYLWDTPHWLDDTRFRQLCPEFVATPVPEVLQAAAAPWLRPKKARPQTAYSMTTSTQTIL